jgi:hypothetical protein
MRAAATRGAGALPAAMRAAEVPPAALRAPAARRAEVGAAALPARPVAVGKPDCLAQAAPLPLAAARPWQGQARVERRAAAPREPAPMPELAWEARHKWAAVTQ